jgi:hypothetical protein
MARGALMLNRPQMLRALPKHVAFAALTGAVAGFILYFLNQIELDGQWNLLMAIPIGAVYVNAAMIPLAIPGRHWSFAFIGAMLLFLLMIAGMIISQKVSFPHSHVQTVSTYDGPKPDSGVASFYLAKVNALTFAGLLSGGCLGLFYGMLAGRLSAMISGLAVGSASGFLLGILSLSAITHGTQVAIQVGSFPGVDKFFRDLENSDNWRYNSPLHFAWQLGVAMALLHLGACLGAALGAGPAPNPQSEIRIPK